MYRMLAVPTEPLGINAWIDLAELQFDCYNSNKHQGMKINREIRQFR